MKTNNYYFHALGCSAAVANEALLKLGRAFSKFKQEKTMPLSTRELAKEVAEGVSDEVEGEAREILHKMIVMKNHAKSVFEQMEDEYNNMLSMSVNDLVLNYGKGAVSKPMAVLIES